MGTKLELEFAHAVVMVCDMERMVDFYTRVLGFEVTDRGPLGPDEQGPQIVFLSQAATHHHQIAFADVRREPGRSNSVDHLAFRSGGSLSDLRDLQATLEAEDGVSDIAPITHGNAWSIYFRDPEGNRVEVFLDTPWHVAQPQIRPLDLSRSDDEILHWTEETYREQPRFGPMADFYASRAEHLSSR
jgi:catechol 2,3-dioxygenase-like lactoylglutathione lyase family enzyme